MQIKRIRLFPNRNPFFESRSLLPVFQYSPFHVNLIHPTRLLIFFYYLIHQSPDITSCFIIF